MRAPWREGRPPPVVVSDHHPLAVVVNGRSEALPRVLGGITVTQVGVRGRVVLSSVVGGVVCARII